MIQSPVITNLALAVIFLSTSGPGIPQKSSFKPDFTGTWNARIVQDGASSSSLKVSYQNPRLKISRTSRLKTPLMVMGKLVPSGSSVDFVCYTDGRGETNPSLFFLGPITSGAVKSTTARVGQQFIIASTFKSSRSGRDVITEVTYTLEVSSDGGALNLKTTTVTDGASQQSDAVFDRVEGARSDDINGRWIEKSGSSIVTLIIEHHDPEIKITRRVLSQGLEHRDYYIYYSDGRGETNVVDGKSKKSTTKWDGNALVSTISSVSRAGDDNISYSQSVKWQMSRDATSLAETVRVNLSTSVGFVTPGSQESKLVFARSSSQLPDK